MPSFTLSLPALQPKPLQTPQMLHPARHLCFKAIKHACITLQALSPWECEDAAPEMTGSLALFPSAFCWSYSTPWAGIQKSSLKLWHTIFWIMHTSQYIEQWRLCQAFGVMIYLARFVCQFPIIVMAICVVLQNASKGNCGIHLLTAIVLYGSGLVNGNSNRRGRHIVMHFNI